MDTEATPIDADPAVLVTHATYCFVCGKPIGPGPAVRKSVFSPEVRHEDCRPQRREYSDAE